VAFESARVFHMKGITAVLRSETLTQLTDSSTLPAERALGIALADALAVYGDLSAYRIGVAIEADGWHVDYELKDLRTRGGGPQYIIDHASGKIISKRYEQ